jgi:hypothetical protein
MSSRRGEQEGDGVAKDGALSDLDGQTYPGQGRGRRSFPVGGVAPSIKLRDPSPIRSTGKDFSPTFTAGLRLANSEELFSAFATAVPTVIFVPLT